MVRMQKFIDYRQPPWGTRALFYSSAVPFSTFTGIFFPCSGS
jgi:hypothetical protein